VAEPRAPAADPLTGVVEEDMLDRPRGRRSVLVDRCHGGEQDQRAEHQAQHITWVAGVPTGPGTLMVVCMLVDPLATTAAGRPRAGHRP
jgi:hypothetical protein